MNIIKRIKKALFVLFLRDNRCNHELSAWEIEKGQLLSRIKRLENKLLDKRMEMMENLLSVKKSENSDMEMMKMLFGMFSNNSTPPSTAENISESTTKKVKELTAEEVKDLVRQYPKIKQIGKSLSPEDLRTQVINYMPNLSKNSLELIEKEVYA